jgi:ubiquinone/menaquinone biosynthesis C-methylase UbiE
MAEWVDETVRRILSLRPKRILEIGCGTGLLLFRIAPSCEQYWATDISQSVTQYVQRHVQANPALGHVKVWQAEASNLGDVPAGQFDVVVINSVIQYFPGAAYLTHVIAQAARTLRPAGVVLVGDVRNFDLLAAFHLSVLLANAKDTETIGDVRATLRSRVEAEPELAVSPAFFATLPNFAVEIEPRRGQFLNEMTRFRYNVLLRVDDSGSNSATPIVFEDWAAGGWTMDRLRQKLSERPASLAFERVPDARTCDSVALLVELNEADDSMSIGAFRNQVSSTKIGIDPEDLWKLESDFPYQVQIGCAQDAWLNVLIQRRDYPAAMSIPAPKPSPGSALTNDPGKNRRNQALVSQLVRALKTELPAHIPAPRVLAVDKLPDR